MLNNLPQGTILGSVIGKSAGQPTPMSLKTTRGVPQPRNKITPATKPREVDMPRGINYYADFSGCGFWRMLWPEQILNAYQQAIIHGSTVMVTDEKYYTRVKCVRLRGKQHLHSSNFRISKKVKRKDEVSYSV